MKKREIRVNFVQPNETPMCSIMDQTIRKWSGISYQWACTSSEGGILLENPKELNTKDVIN